MARYNVAVPLETPTYDGSGQAVHPSIVRFADGWNGHKYWMVYTPYPDGANALENPSIVVSEDGVAWAPPVGLSNPIVQKPAGGNSFNSDPELVFDAAADRLVCFWREALNGGDTVTLKAADSLDGVSWSAPVALFDVDAGLSPSVVFDGSVWRMWTVKYDAGSPFTLLARTAAGPFGPWSAPEVCDIAAAGRRDIWHPAVFIDDSGTFRMLLADANAGTSHSGTMLLASSSDGMSWSVLSDVHAIPLGKVVPPAAGWEWQSHKIYRATGFQAGDVCRVWYSAMGRDGSGADYWRIGYTEWPMSLFPTAPAAPPPPPPPPPPPAGYPSSITFHDDGTFSGAIGTMTVAGSWTETP